MKTKATHHWRWKYCYLQDDRVALMRCSKPRPWTLGRFYALTCARSLFVIVQPSDAMPRFPGAWLITDMCAPTPFAGQPDHAPEMLVDGIRRALGYWPDPPAGGIVAYPQPGEWCWSGARALAAVGFVEHPDQALADGRIPWHLPAEALPKPDRRRSGTQRTRAQAGYRRGERI